MENIFKKGEYLEIETLNNETYGGYFCSQNKENTRLSLCNVRLLPDGNISELFHFSTSDIKFAQKKDQQPMDNIIINMTSQMKESKLSQDKQQPYVSENGISKYVFINQADNRCLEAVCDLKMNPYVAVGTDGAELGRKCKLSILTVSTPLQTYIFDIQTLQDDTFKGGIKQLLENPDITKIIHNSRKLSDCLFHKHEIKLNKVFDTQAADIIIQKQKCGSFPAEARSLSDCLNTYLGLKNHISEKMDIVELTKRPLPSTLKEIAIKNIVHLHQLHEAINKQIMAPFMRGFQFYVNCERQCSDSEAWYLCSQDKKPPKSYQEAVEDY